MKTNKVVADTNALIYAVQKKRDIFEDLTKYLGSFEIVVLKRVRKELEKKAVSGKTKANAKIALELLDKMKEVDYGSENERTDDLILKYAAENDVYVFTYDKKLKQRLKKADVKIVETQLFE